MEGGCLLIDLGSLEVDQLLRPQSMPIGDQHEGGIARPWASVLPLFLAALMSFSISCGVRYSRLRRSALTGLSGIVRFWCAGSSDRCNTGIKSLGWGFEAQSLTWPFI